MKLSIVVCAYNEEKSIGPLLENLQRQKIPPEFSNREIIVVTSGCTDETVNVAKRHMNENSNVKLIQEETRLGKASALNRALEASSGEYSALVPADVEPADGALFNLLIPFRNESVVAVSGNPSQNPLMPARSFSSCLARKTYKVWGKLMKKLNDTGQMVHCSGEFMAVRSDVKPYVPSRCAADDSYIAIMARKKGLIVFAPEAVCYNLVPSTIADYVNQRRRWLCGHFQAKKITGEYPTVLDTMVLSKPRVAFQVLAEEIIEWPKEAGYLLSAMVVEVIIYSLSVIDRVFARQWDVWPVVRSTKHV
jgi:biofilm PGA synthesis N-glycosyltransferase PgaC